MRPFNSQLMLSEAVYNDSAYLDHARLDKVRQNGSPELREVLNSAVVYAYGSNEQYGTQNFPILWQTQAKGNKRAVRSIDGVYYNYLFGKPKKTSVIGKTIYQTTDKIGVDGELFYLFFKDRFFQKNQILYIGGMNGYQVQVGGLPVKDGSLWKYEARQMGGKKGKGIPFKYVQAGAVWSGGVIKVSLARSRGTEHRSHAPYSIQNQLSTIRHSFNVAGNAARKVMNFTVKANGKSMNLWAEWERFDADLRFNEAKDVDLMFSKYNKDAEGVVINYDADSGEVVYSGMGLWDQVPTCNELPYTRLTEARLSAYIDDILTITQQLDVVDKNNIEVDVMGGMGFLTEVNDALKRNTQLLQPIQSDLFITKKDGGLEYGNYFVRYKHRTGVVFRFTWHPGFDFGTIAESADRHPLNPSRPVTSYNAFIGNFGRVSTSSDVSSSGSAGAIQYVYEEGREHIEKFVPGMAYMPGISGNMAATDVDASGWHMMTTQGIHSLHPMSMGKITCQLS
jgi:hypothetical protein